MLQRPGGCRGSERLVRRHQSGPGRAAGRGSPLHDGDSSAYRQRRVAEHAVADTGEGTVFCGDLHPPAAVAGPSRAGARTVGDGSGRSHLARQGDHRRAHRAFNALGGRAGTGRHPETGGRPHDRELRQDVRRLRGRAEVPDAAAAHVPHQGVEAIWQGRVPTSSDGDAPENAGRRGLRSDRFRSAPLLDRPDLDGAALREDALRPGAWSSCLFGGLRSDPRALLPHRGRGDLDLR